MFFPTLILFFQCSGPEAFERTSPSPPCPWEPPLLTPLKPLNGLSSKFHEISFILPRFASLKYFGHGHSNFSYTAA